MQQVGYGSRKSLIFNFHFMFTCEEGRDNIYWQAWICVGGQALIQETTSQFGEFEDDLSDNLESFMGVGDNNWEEWEEWMGWEGAGTYDYTNHINPIL